MYINILEERVL